MKNSIKCTGYCQSCGRCQGAKMIKGANRRKTKLMQLPVDFIPEKNVEGKSNCEYGIAFDIGTTTVVGMLWNLSEGKYLGAIAKTNPQNSHGGDVISRITFSEETEENLQQLRDEIIYCLEEIGKELCSKQNEIEDNINKIVIGGNTTMSHIVAGYSPSSLARSPFTPEYEGALEFAAGEFQIEKFQKNENSNHKNNKGDCINNNEVSIFKNAVVQIIPNIAGHVGGDITAGIVAARILDEVGASLFIDIGTNGEIVLAKNGKAVCCSTAAGPAFEGASIKDGMRAAPGAIEKVEIIAGEIVFQTVENQEPMGICGSGLIDAIAALLSEGIIKRDGRIIAKDKCKSNLASRIRESEKGREFLLVEKENGEEIVISQQDVREVQLAKGAILAGISILLKEMNLSTADIEQIIIAGAFGNFIDKKSAVTIGLLPEVAEEIVFSAGNTAGAGASMILTSSKEEALAREIPKIVEHIELSTCKGFQDEYMRALSFN
ncbi:MAG: ASKHA domain-containing protein [Anaerovoracaceae bacterium]